MAKTGYVYAYSLTKTDAVKVGRTSDPVSRFRALRTGSPFEMDKRIVLDVGSYEDAVRVERQIKDTLSAHHRHGEWFGASAAISDVMKSVKGATDVSEILDVVKSTRRMPKIPDSPMGMLKKYLWDNRETQKEFAARIGISQKHLSRIINGHDRPTEQLRRHIALATGGRVEPAE